ncbi:hypothetical protein G6F51_014429 [Rhizopus arrhizus]|uniref:Uncharacterized protein n=1 Tax=Rhizopus oryzae TaxID=64495 RepID=A0A9P6XM27_RHIOR|nr:hypothetical protein G6F51_014429 [Rhizopus arrhizus]
MHAGAGAGRDARCAGSLPAAVPRCAHQHADRRQPVPARRPAAWHVRRRHHHGGTGRREPVAAPLAPQFGGVRHAARPRAGGAGIGRHRRPERAPAAGGE